MVSGIVMLIDVEVESICAWAIVDVVIIVGVSSTQVVVYIVPSVLIAGILMEGVMSAVMDYEVKSVNIGAS